MGNSPEGNPAGGNLFGGNLPRGNFLGLYFPGGGGIIPGAILWGEIVKEKIYWGIIYSIGTFPEGNSLRGNLQEVVGGGGQFTAGKLTHGAVYWEVIYWRVGNFLVDAILFVPFVPSADMITYKQQLALIFWSLNRSGIKNV